MLDDKGEKMAPSNENRGYGSASQSYWVSELLQFYSVSRILQKWEPVEHIGKGAYARVFRVRNFRTGEEAALKYIPNPVESVSSRPKGSSTERDYRDEYRKSQQEAQLMMRFRNKKNIIQYLEEPEFLERTFRSANGESVVQYAVLILMPLCKNQEEWSKAIRDDKQSKLQLGIDISAALSIFEDENIFHRDVKPENILRGDDGRFYLSDIGEAKLEISTTTIGFHGTREYMAPEVYTIRGNDKHRSDHRSDIYSLGIVLYRLFNNGQFPFIGSDGALTAGARKSLKESKKSTIHMSASEGSMVLRYGGVALPDPCEADKDLAWIIKKACAFRAEDRFQSARELHNRLESYSHGDFDRSGQTGTVRGPVLGTPPDPQPRPDDPDNNPLTIKDLVKQGAVVCAKAIATCAVIAMIAIIVKNAMPFLMGKTPEYTALPTQSPWTPAFTTVAPSSEAATQEASVALTPTTAIPLTATATPTPTAVPSPTSSPASTLTPEPTSMIIPTSTSVSGSVTFSGQATGTLGNRILAIVTFLDNAVIFCEIQDNAATSEMRELYSHICDMLVETDISRIMGLTKKEFWQWIKESDFSKDMVLSDGSELQDSAYNSLTAIKNAIQNYEETK